MKKGSKNAQSGNGNSAGTAQAKARQAERNDRRESRHGGSGYGSGYDDDLLGGYDDTPEEEPKADPFSTTPPVEEEHEGGEEGQAPSQEANGIEEMESHFNEMKAKFEQEKAEELEAMRKKAEDAEKALEAMKQKAEEKPKAIQKAETTEEVLQKAEKAVMLGKRLAFLKAKRDQLAAMTFQEEQVPEQITLADARNSLFKVTNQKLIDGIKDLIFAELDKELKITTAQILAI